MIAKLVISLLLLLAISTSLFPFLCLCAPPRFTLSFLSNTAPGSNRPLLLCGHGGFIETLKCLKTREERGGGGCWLATFTSQKRKKKRKNKINFFFANAFGKEKGNGS